MGKDNEIFYLVPPAHVWSKVATFADPDLKSINTYVVSPKGDKLILISPLTVPAK
jgi:hypothetical protein